MELKEGAGPDQYMVGAPLDPKLKGLSAAIAFLYPDLPIGVRPVVVANVATYVLLGVIFESIRQHYRRPEISNGVPMSRS